MEEIIQPKSREEWLALVKEYENSNFSQSEFCKERNLTLHKFVYYRQQLRLQNDKSSVQHSFTPVVVSSSQKINANEIKIELPNGFCCYVSSNIQSEHLKKLLGTILSC